MLKLPILHEVVLWTDDARVTVEAGTSNHDENLRNSLELVCGLDPVLPHLKLLIVVTSVLTMDYDDPSLQLQMRAVLRQLSEDTQTVGLPMKAVAIGTGLTLVQIVVNVACEEAVQVAFTTIMECANTIGTTSREAMSEVESLARTLLLGANDYNRASAQLSQVQGKWGLETRIPPLPSLAVAQELQLEGGWCDGGT